MILFTAPEQKQKIVKILKGNKINFLYYLGIRFLENEVIMQQTNIFAMKYKGFMLLITTQVAFTLLQVSKDLVLPEGSSCGGILCFLLLLFCP